ncbi:MAG TPA: CoA transferase [Steroidobacter sp.]
MKSRLPLQGVRVVDFTTLLPGPLATLMLGEAGAEVVKIERPGGDDMRRLGARLPSGKSVLFEALNRNKRIVEMDLRDPGGVRQARELVTRADVVVEQSRPGVMARLGLGYSDMKALNPRLIYCSITGYGQSGPRSQDAGHDLNYVADAGLLANVAGCAGEPVLPPTLIADIGGGTLPATLNILLALRQRDMTGEGCHIDISMSECVLLFQPFAYADVVAHGRPGSPGCGLLTGGSPRYRLYRAADDRWLAVGALEEKFWRNFCDVIRLPEGLRDDTADPASTTMAVQKLIGEHSSAEWLRRFAGRDACVSLVRSFDEVMRAPEFGLPGLSLAGLDADSQDAACALPLPLSPAFRRPAHR